MSLEEMPLFLVRPNAAATPSGDDSSELYVDDRALSRMLGCSRVTLQQARARGEGIPYIKIGRLVRYSTRTVREWLTANTRGAMPASGDARKQA